MRCRRIRSCLSAYCREELTPAQQLAVSEHLSTCPDCRREESEYRALLEAAVQVPSRKVSPDFTTQLFNRIAQERFAETRTKAYLPKRAPLVRWQVAAPVLASACVLALVAFTAFWPGVDQPGGMMAGVSDEQLPRHLTVQPTHNPNMTVSLEKDWSLAAQMARAERLNRLSQAVGAQVEFHGLGSSYGATNVAARNGAAPYISDFYRIRPVLRDYQNPDAAREVNNTY